MKLTGGFGMHRTEFVALFVTCDNFQLFTCVDVHEENSSLGVSKRSETKYIVKLHIIGSVMVV